MPPFPTHQVAHTFGFHLTILPAPAQAEAVAGTGGAGGVKDAAEAPVPAGCLALQPLHAQLELCDGEGGEEEEGSPRFPSGMGRARGAAVGRAARPGSLQVCLGGGSGALQACLGGGPGAGEREDWGGSR